MGYFLTTEPENAVPGKSWVMPKTHTPGSPVKERGYRFYMPDVGRWVNRDLVNVDLLILYVYFGNDPFLSESSAGTLTDSLPYEKPSLTVYGETKCGLSKPVNDPMIITINNTSCTKGCTQEHENQHASDQGSCCKKAREAYQKKGASQSDVLKKWNDYVTAAEPWTECNAYGKSVSCAEGLWSSRKCDCPDAKDKQCCADIKSYKSNAESQKQTYCWMQGSASAPACPF